MKSGRVAIMLAALMVTSVTIAPLATGEKIDSPPVQRFEEVRNGKEGAIVNENTKSPTNITYSDLAVSPSIPNSSEPVLIQATVENRGNQFETFNATLIVDGEILAFEAGGIKPGKEQTITFHHRFSSVGEHKVTIGDLPEKLVTVVWGPTITANGQIFPTPSSLDGEIREVQNQTTSSLPSGAVMLVTGEEAYLVFGYDKSVGRKTTITAQATGINVSDKNISFQVLVVPESHGMGVSSMETLASTPKLLRVTGDTVNPGTTGTIQVEAQNVDVVLVGVPAVPDPMNVDLKNSVRDCGLFGGIPNGNCQILFTVKLSGSTGAELLLSTVLGVTARLIASRLPVGPNNPIIQGAISSLSLFLKPVASFIISTLLEQINLAGSQIILWVSTPGGVGHDAPVELSVPIQPPTTTYEGTWSLPILAGDMLPASISPSENGIATLEINKNDPPDADARAKTTVEVGEHVTLDGSISSDPDDDSLSFKWEQTGGPKVVLRNAETSSPEFTAPSVSQETTLTFQLMVSDGNGGSDTITVRVNVIPSGVPVTLDITSESTSPGATSTIEFEATNDGTQELTGVLVNITGLPSEWSIVSHTNAGAAYREDSMSWLWLNFPAKTTKTPSITIQIPNGTEPGEYEVSADLLNNGIETSSTTMVTVAENNEFDLVIDGGPTTPGSNMSIEFQAMNNGNEKLTGVLVSVVELPSGWSAIAHKDAGGNYRESSMDWLWLTFPAKGEKSPSLTVYVPNETEPGDYEISAEMVTKDTEIRTTSTVRVSNSRTVTVAQVIAGEDGVIRTSEVIEAIEFWASRDTVPETGGKKIRTEVVLELIGHWQTGEPVS